MGKFCYCFSNIRKMTNIMSKSKSFQESILIQKQFFDQSFGQSLITQRNKQHKDFLGLGVPEIAICLVAALVLFGPETLKSLSKDMGKAAAELKEIPKTFKEGMDEGAESVQVAKMKAIAAEKRKKRDEKLIVDDESTHETQESIAE